MAWNILEIDRQNSGGYRMQGGYGGLGEGEVGSKRCQEDTWDSMTSNPKTKCLLSVAYHQMPAIKYLLSNAYYQMPTIRCLLSDANHQMPTSDTYLQMPSNKIPTVRCLLLNAHYQMPTFRCLLSDI